MGPTLVTRRESFAKVRKDFANLVNFVTYVRWLRPIEATLSTNTGCLAFDALRKPFASLTFRRNSTNQSRCFNRNPGDLLPMLLLPNFAQLAKERRTPCSFELDAPVGDLLQFVFSNSHRHCSVLAKPLSLGSITFTGTLIARISGLSPSGELSLLPSFHALSILAFPFLIIRGLRFLSSPYSQFLSV